MSRISNPTSMHMLPHTYTNGHRPKTESKEKKKRQKYKKRKTDTKHSSKLNDESNTSRKRSKSVELGYQDTYIHSQKLNCFSQPNINSDLLNRQPSTVVPLLNLPKKLPNETTQELSLIHI
eukprot:TRINITY_DN5339_c0_g1_i1.p1 TRINITY_DN5339_c0_g1~~TRINITY_DN5339_c0_g1_i1.p1  ORF type:complete len:121 (+),score=14.50 TRINITY_DN5339_c0_g1_i1:93-455(+)